METEGSLLFHKILPLVPVLSWKHHVMWVLVTTAWHILGLWVEEMASRY